MCLSQLTPRCNAILPQCCIGGLGGGGTAIILSESFNFYRTPNAVYHWHWLYAQHTAFFTGCLVFTVRVGWGALWCDAGHTWLIVLGDFNIHAKDRSLELAQDYIASLTWPLSNCSRPKTWKRLHHELNLLHWTFEGRYGFWRLSLSMVWPLSTKTMLVKNSYLMLQSIL